MAARSHPTHGAYRFGGVSEFDGSRAPVGSRRRRVRVCTDAPSEHLDASGRQPADTGARGPFVDRCERDVFRGVSGIVVEVLAPVEDFRWRARLLGIASF